MVQLGFGQLYNSVYIYPWDITSKVLELLDNLELEDYVTIITSQNFIINRVNVNIAAKIWNIEEKNKLYQTKFDWYTTEIGPKINNFIHGNTSDLLEIFLIYLLVIDTIDELLTLDPMLPPEILPGNWLGPKVLSTLYKAKQTLAKLIPTDSIYHEFIE
ncbi:hypothetical protein CJ195_12095 [Bacillus sp. UMB0899]|nr:hypothetical protein CJ195_12095 [Bacillus sp. UMB0899]